ncbi:energy-coupling factor transporter transmembrane protein EcfT [Natronoarchaeum mannanilyticum]|uniref:Energy-coupling factor transporter transmembrane component T n=1 Tax=Natronoarchaeum mannanilyticum TaxID=926360 RepID=A0AAV3T817_9EURY
MLAYEPGDSPAHRLDPRTKLAAQFGFAIAAFGHGGPEALALLTAVALAAPASAGLSPFRALAAFRFVLVILLVAPLVAAATLGPPWLDVSAGAASALASYRVLLVLLVSAAYVASTPARDSRTAIQWLLPGRIGVTLGVGVGLVFRFFPVLLSDLRSIRDAMAARGGDRGSFVERARRIGVRGVDRTFRRADRLAVALQARCFAWNPTLPTLSFGTRDAPVLALAVGLAISPLL